MKATKIRPMSQPRIDEDRIAVVGVEELERLAVEAGVRVDAEAHDDGDGDQPTDRQLTDRAVRARPQPSRSPGEPGHAPR